MLLANTKTSDIAGSSGITRRWKENQLDTLRRG